MPVVTKDSLVTPAEGRAVFKFHSDVYFKATYVGVAVRDSAGTNLDYPSASNNVNIGPEGYVYISDPRTKLAPGTYTVWGFYYLGGWKNTGTVTLVVPADEPPPPPPPPSSKTVVFSGPFDAAHGWNIGKSSAYPGTGPTNTGDSKLDYISGSNYPSATGVFTADRRDTTYWNTDLATTEYAPNGFEILPGDEVTATVTLGPEQGAWPAIWTWGRDNPPGYSGVQPGHGEIDLFEYHPDNADLLELSNHVRGGGKYWRSPQVLPGTPWNLRVVFGLASVDWYVNDVLIYADGRGVPSYWRAWPIVNLSVSSGTWHPAPTATQTHMQYSVTDFKVWR